MGRPPRLCFEGAVYHVTSRGDNRELVFRDQADYQQYLLLLRQYKDEFKFSLYAYALMPNHVHLIIEPALDATISRIMQHVGSTFTKYINRRYERVGHVFQGRFHSRVIGEDIYLLVASRYVHLNPVRAQMVQEPVLYPWSSYRAYIDSRAEANPLRLIDTQLVHSLVVAWGRPPHLGYRDFVEAGLHQAAEVWDFAPEKNGA